MPRISVARATTARDRDRAAEVWAAADLARDRPAGELRAARVRDKIDRAELLLIACYGERVAGMLLAEQFVDGAENGPEPETAHVAMVHVHPALWGSGIGSALLRDLQGREWSRLSAWFRDDNRRARRLFTTVGFADTGHRAHLQDGDVIQQWRWARPDVSGVSGI